MTAAHKQAVEILQRHYGLHIGLQGELSPLPGENTNFLFSLDGQPRFVLKIADLGQSVEEIEMENAAAVHLASKCENLSFPTCIATSSGDSLVKIDQSNGSSIVARLQTFVRGIAWCELEQRSSQLQKNVGLQLAEIHLALADFQHPSENRTHQWDLANAGQHRASIPLIENKHRRKIAEWMFQFWAAAAKRKLERCPQSFIHGDVNDENMLVNAHGITGLLDFGDALQNPTVCGLAIALAYLTLADDSPLRAASEIIAGYEQFRPLEQVEKDVLFPLICGRLVVSATIAARRRHEDPSRENWFVTEERAWRALEKFYELEPNIAQQHLFQTDSVVDDQPVDELLKRRKQSVGRNLSVSYRQPIKMAKGRGQYLFSDMGKPFLDMVNNVSHVGHCHPRVVAVAQEQIAKLNTNSRYLYEAYTDYTERLCSTLPDSLSVCYLVNSGSEANELAIRLARAHTSRKDMIVLDGAYHGNTNTLIALSPYKFQGPGGSGQPEPWVHVVEMPDGYRGIHRGHGEEVGEKYADDVQRVISESVNPIAGFLVESILSCGGQIVLPEGYLDRAFEHVRAAGGVCIIDEVQVGFGRVGNKFWGFKLQNVVPDIVVMGKPIGNGHPLGAVVTTPEIAASFDNGMEYFCTFGGNPVSCEIGNAVLDVIENEGLQQHALEVGERLKSSLEELKERHPLIGDVRGRGLFLGVELVRSHETLEPAAKEAEEIVNLMRDRGILLSTDGPLHNVIKIKPPMVIQQDDTKMVVRVLDDVFRELEQRT